MALVTTIAAPEADSYLSLAEADAYLAGRDGFAAADLAGWQELPEAGREWRLRLAALVLNTLPWRGGRVAANQGLAFPRLLPGHALLPHCGKGSAPNGGAFADWAQAQERAVLLGVELPEIPAGVTIAQAEIAFQVVHMHLARLEPMASGDLELARLELDGIGALTRDGSAGAGGLFAKARFGAMAVAELHLAPYLTRLRGRLA